MASTLEWRKKVLQSQQATQTIPSSSCKQQPVEELGAIIGGIREHYHKQEERLEMEIVKLEQTQQRYESHMKQLGKEECEEENYSVAG